MTDARLAEARARAMIARRRLQETAQELQFRLKPATVAAETGAVIRQRGSEIAEDAAAVLRRRPVAISATTIGLGALLGAGLFARRRAKRGQETS